MSKKTIVIVGASKGIGRSLVKNLASNTDNTVIALSRGIQEMNNNFAECENVKSFEFDLQQPVKAQIQSIISSVGTIDILINNAGHLVNKPFLELSSKELQDSYQVNVIGVIETVQEFFPHMNPNGAHIVNISSMGGFQGTVKFPGLVAYSTSKAALCSFTELFAEEFKESPTKMNCLCLGAAQTEMLEKAFPGYKAPVSADKMAEFIADFALKGNQWFNGKILPVSLSTP